MKIAYICPFYEPAICGVKQSVRELAGRMIKKGHEVHVFTSDWDKQGRIKRKEEVIEEVFVHRCFHIAKLANFVSLWPSVFFKLLKEDFNIIHSHNFGHPHVFLGALAAKIKKIPHIHTTHCPWSDAKRGFIGDFLMKLSYNTIGKLSLKLSNYIIAITPWEIRYIQEYLGNSTNSIIKIISNGVDKEFFKKIKPNLFKQKYGLNKKIVLFLGRFNPTKGAEKLALAATGLVKTRNDFVFMFIGPDEGTKEEVRSIVKNSERIHILDPVRNRKKIVEIYQAADIYALPSYREGLPLTLFEALASGLPIIASPVNGIPYEIKDPDNCIFVNYGDIEGLKKAILSILDNHQIATIMRRNNLEKAKKYDWNLIAEETDKLYRKSI